MKAWTCDTQSELQTMQLGHLLARRLPRGTPIAINGTLGAGKTRLVQGLAEGLGIHATDVVSPTFGICHEHEGDPGLNHLDLYRVTDADELLELGFDEYCSSSRITAIEWADRFPEEMPVPRLDVTIEIRADQENTQSEEGRRFYFQSVGGKLDAALAQIADLFRHAMDE